MKSKIALFMMLFIMPISVKAFGITCDKYSIRYNQEIECKIVSDEIKNYLNVEGNLVFPDDLSCSIKSYGKNIKGSYSKGKIIMSGEPDNNLFATIKCGVKRKIYTPEVVSITVDNFKYKTEDEESETLVLRSASIKIIEETTTTTTTKPRNVSNNDSLLESVSDPNLKIDFSRFVTSYSVEVPYTVSAINLEYTPVNKNATVEMKGSNTLLVGENTIDLYVTSPDKKSTTCYTFTIHRLSDGEKTHDDSSDSSLSSMSITGYNIKFKSSIKDYILKINEEDYKLDIIPVTNSDKASYEILGNNDLKEGSKITIVVTSFDKKSTTKYLINIKKTTSSINVIPFLIVFVIVAVVVVLIYIIITLTKEHNEKDPILKLKNKRKKKSKIALINQEIPEVQNVVNQQQNIMNNTNNNHQTNVVTNQQPMVNSNQTVVTQQTSNVSLGNQQQNNVNIQNNLVNNSDDDNDIETL